MGKKQAFSYRADSRKEAKEFINPHLRRNYRIKISKRTRAGHYIVRLYKK